MTKVITKVFNTPTEVLEGCNIALKSRLYVSGWNLSGELKYLRKYPFSGKVSITFADDKPVAVAVLRGGVVECFCRKSERKKGYGGKTLSSLLSKEREVTVCQGIEGSYSFFSKAIPSSVKVCYI